MTEHVEDVGMKKALKWARGKIGTDWITERDLVQGGRRVGTLPSDFAPASIKSTSFFYDPRPGDFRREGTAWVASPALGPGDLAAVPGFVWED